MKSTIYILMTVILFFSCGTPCKNGGVYDKGKCECLEGWEGEDCSIEKSIVTENPNPAIDNAIISSENAVSGFKYVRKLFNSQEEIFGIGLLENNSYLFKSSLNGSLSLLGLTQKVKIDLLVTPKKV